MQQLVTRCDPPRAHAAKPHSRPRRRTDEFFLLGGRGAMKTTRLTVKMRGFGPNSLRGSSLSRGHTSRNPRRNTCRQNLERCALAGGSNLTFEREPHTPATKNANPFLPRGRVVIV